MGTIQETSPQTAENQSFGVERNSGPAPDAPKSVGSFKYRITLNGAPIGWLGKGGSQSMWAQVVADEKDAVILKWYAFKGVNYLNLENFGYMTWSGGLSGAPVAFNTWPYANGWKEEGGHLIAADSGAPLSEYRTDVPWLYANKDYSVVGVSRVDV